MTTSTPTPTNNLLQARINQAKAQQEQLANQFQEQQQKLLEQLQATSDTMEKRLSKFKTNIGSTLTSVESDISNAIAGLSTQQLITQLQQEQQALTNTIQALQQEQAQLTQEMIDFLAQNKKELQGVQEILLMDFTKSIKELHKQIEHTLCHQLQNHQESYQNQAQMFSNELTQWRKLPSKSMAEMVLQEIKSNKYLIMGSVFLVISVLMCLIFSILIYVALLTQPAQNTKNLPHYKPAPLKSYSQFYDYPIHQPTQRKK